MKTGSRLIVIAAAAALAGGIGTYAFTASSQEAGGGFGPPFMRGGGAGGMMGGHGMMGMNPRMMGGGGPMGGPGMMGMGPGSMGPGLDPSARLDSLKTELAITPAQESAWTEYSKTLDDTAAAMRSAREGVKAAADKLIAVLDEAQKTKARDILPGLGTPGPAMMRHGGMHGPMGFGRPSER